MLKANSVEESTNILNKSLDKILATHRNTRMFLFMLTGPFFLFFMVFKYSMKAIIITYLWRKRKRERLEREALEALKAESGEAVVVAAEKH